MKAFQTQLQTTATTTLKNYVEEKSRQHNATSNKAFWVDFLAGGCAGVAETLLMHPLDTIKVK